MKKSLKHTLAVIGVVAGATYLLLTHLLENTEAHATTEVAIASQHVEGITAEEQTLHIFAEALQQTAETLTTTISQTEHVLSAAVGDVETGSTMIVDLDSDAASFDAEAASFIEPASGDETVAEDQ